jgi:polyisoprenoid-binding protein YceI
MLRLLGLLLLPIALSEPAAAAPWTLDPTTSVEASIDWQGRPIAVHFPGLSGSVDFDAEHPETARARLAVPAGGATTGNPIVDAIMRGGDYLAAGSYPTISFDLGRLTRTSKDTADVTGSVTFRGVTRPVRLKAKVLAYGPSRNDPGLMRADFAISGEIDRRDFGSTAGVPDISAVMPLDIRLTMTTR